MHKRLQKVLGIFLDTETNGLNFLKHKILEIALKIYDLSNKQELASYEAKIWISFEDWQQSDLNSLQVTGFTYDEIRKGKKITNVKDQIIKIFQSINIKKENSIFICQNPSFDRAFFSQIIAPDEQEVLKLPYHWLDLASMFFAAKMQNEQKLISWEIDFSKDNIASEYNLSKEEKPHRAMNGVKHLIKCYEKVIGFPLENK
jgi:oligoribonuclease (3'-5' exoribonuclease)